MLARKAVQKTLRRISAPVVSGRGASTAAKEEPVSGALRLAGGLALGGLATAGAIAGTEAPVEAERRELYPPIEPYNTGFIQRGPFKVYYEESGNPEGQPVLVVHGGPGGGSSPAYRRFFDPKHYRIIQFDQRGCGKSTPHASLEANNTWELVGDMEALRKHLRIEQWHLFGGSWGSTLSLTYAEMFPDFTASLVLRGIFMLRKCELDWYYQEGASYIFPDEWEAYSQVIPTEERGNMMAAYRRRLTSENEHVRTAAAKAWTSWEMRTSTLMPASDEKKKRGQEDKFALAFARIENHYFTHGGFFPTDQFLLEHAYRLRNIPGVIVQGRYDVVCPMRSAWDLHRMWPEADLHVIPDAGHSAMEAGIRSELVKATDRMRSLTVRREPLQTLTPPLDVARPAEAAAPEAKAPAPAADQDDDGELASVDMNDE